MSRALTLAWMRRRARSPLLFWPQQFVAEMVELLADQHLLAVVGPSGCGKSSVVMAGLLPELKAGRFRQ